MRKVALYLGAVLPGLGAVAVCGYFLARDWAALTVAFARLEKAAAAHDLPGLAVAQAFDSVYRVNCLADGVGLMLGAVLFAIGVHGLCLLPGAGRWGRERSNRGDAEDAEKESRGEREMCG